MPTDSGTAADRAFVIGPTKRVTKKTGAKKKPVLKTSSKRKAPARKRAKKRK